jgi:hypothetical protein
MVLPPTRHRAHGADPDRAAEPVTSAQRRVLLTVASGERPYAKDHPSLQWLQRNGLISYDEQEGYRLTAKGHEIASRREANPSTARTLYQRFRGRTAARAQRIGVRFGTRWLTAPGDSNLVIPVTLAIVGHVAALEYDTTRDGKTVRARHEFAQGSRPLFAVGAGRGQLFLIGDRFRFTERGIMDITPSGALMDGGLLRSGK